MSHYVKVRRKEQASDERGVVYLIHFDQPFIGQRKNPNAKKSPIARHYLGWALNLDARITEHRNGNGSRLMAAVAARGITWQVTRTWENSTRTREPPAEEPGQCGSALPRLQEREGCVMVNHTTDLRNSEMTNPCIDFDLEKIQLLAGGHGDRFTGAVYMVECANVAAACIPELREKYGKAKFMDDHPSISRVVRSFSISWNDGLNDEDRNRLLKPRVLQILGTKTTPEDEETRAWMATDWLARVHTPAWLRLAGLTKEAQAIEATARIVDAVTASAAQPALDAARTSAAAAWAAARAAAWAAARAAAWAAARKSLRPTVVALQESAAALLDAMCAVGREQKAAA